MHHIAYNHEQLLYNTNILDESEKTNFIIREVSDAAFHVLQNLPSNVFALGKNVRDLVEGVLRAESLEEAA